VEIHAVDDQQPAAKVKKQHGGNQQHAAKVKIHAADDQQHSAKVKKQDAGD